MERKLLLSNEKQCIAIGVLMFLGLLITYTKGLEKFDREFGENIHRRGKPMKELVEIAARHV